MTVTALGTVPAQAAPSEASATATPTVSAKFNSPVRAKYVQRYHLKRWELRQIKAAKQWARQPKAISVRQCESGNNYRINTGNGYYGAYQFAAGTWWGVGGRRYATYAHQAPRFAQDHMAWKLWRQSGWGPWSCA